MATHLPESETPDVRDYLYVDTTRVRSLLSQTNEGLPDEQSSSRTRSRRLLAGLGRLGYEQGRTETSGETMSVADLHVSMLEESAEALGLLADVSDKIQREKNWLRGKVRKRLQPGMLLRVTAPTVLADPASLLAVFRDMQEVADSEDEEFDQFIEVMAALYGSAIAVSIRPTAEESERAAFVGAIPTNHGFSPLARELLLARVGPVAQEMTNLVQVAQIPTEHDSGLSLEAEIARLMERFEGINEGDSLDREVTDGLLTKMAEMMEHSGLAAAPKWPAVSVVPLAIYRQVMPVASAASPPKVSIATDSAMLTGLPPTAGW